MPDVGEVRYRATLDTDKMNSDIGKAEGKLSGLKGVFSSIGSAGVTAVKGIGTAFVGLSSAAASAFAVVSKMGIEYNAQMQSYQTAFTTMLGDAEKAQ